MKKFLMYFMAVLFAGMTFTSCQKNDPASLIQGKWSAILVSMTEDGQTQDVKIETPSYMYYTFLADGNYLREVNAMGEQGQDEGTWELKDKILILDKGSYDELEYSVLELTASKLVVKAQMGSLSLKMDFNKVK